MNTQQEPDDLATELENLMTDSEEINQELIEQQKALTTEARSVGAVIGVSLSFAPPDQRLAIAKDLDMDTAELRTQNPLEQTFSMIQHIREKNQWTDVQTSISQHMGGQGLGI